MEKLALVACGGALGAVARFLTVGWTARATGEAFWGTLLVNGIGSFAMGVIAILLVERFPEQDPRFAPFLMAGLLGGFTTFSAFSLDVVRLFEQDRLSMAAGYAVLSFVLSILGLALGAWICRILTT
ncbi:MAG: CrcB family protein [Pseudomonadota bacterium]